MLTWLKTVASSDRSQVLRKTLPFPLHLLLVFSGLSVLLGTGWVRPLEISASENKRLAAKVVDSSGAGIEGVVIEVLGKGDRFIYRTRSGPDGKFSLPQVTSQVRLRLQHPEFETQEQDPLPQTPEAATLTVVLKPKKVHETVTVTATRTPRSLETIPAAARVVSEAELQRSPALTLDDTLRQVPTFSLFRRSSSLVAHPTTQGVSLRGIGPSGVSRTLVLWDGIPLNDPFGGWIYWSQLEKNSLDQVEIVPGGGSSLYGNSALGGVIQLISRAPEANRVELDLQGGSQGTASGDLLGSYVKGPWSGNFSGSFLNMDGYPIVPDSVRGLVDERAGLVLFAVRAGMFYAPRAGQSAFFHASHFSEDRDNGTALQRNSTDISSLRLGYRREGRQGREWQLRAYGLLEKFKSNFTAVSANRQRETLTLDQTVPVRSVGGSAQWTGLISRHLITAGSDWQWIRGNSEELGYSAGSPSRFQVAGGSQQVGGLFVQDLFNPTSRLFVQLGARLDGWTNYAAERRDLQFATDQRSSTSFLTQRRGTTNPRAGISYRLSDHFTFRSAYYHSFRAPTLNELYRGFRVGNVVTNPNDALGPEKLRGAEAGLDFRLQNKWSGRVTAYWNRLENAVSNVTVTTSPTLITRRRQNVGEIRAKGIEAEGAFQFQKYWSLRGAYLWSDSKVTDFPPNPILESKLLAQVPKHRVTASLNYSNPRVIEVFVTSRFVGQQFDDDLNQFSLGNFTVADAYVGRSFNRSLRIYFAVENLFDRQFVVARTPLENIGAPRMLHAGLKITF